MKALIEFTFLLARWLTKPLIHWMKYRVAPDAAIGTLALDPTKPVVGNDPLELSPRRSFAAWSEIVRGTALPWSGAEIALARGFGASLAAIVVQVSAVRMLIAQHQMDLTRATVAHSREPVIVVSGDQRVLFANDAFFALARRTFTPVSATAAAGPGSTGAEVARLMARPARARRALARVHRGARCP